MSWIVAGSLAGIGAISGMMKQQQAQKNEDRSRQLAAETQRYSPWTHMQAGPIQYADNSAFGGALGGALQGGTAGIMATGALKTPTAGTAAPIADSSTSQLDALLAKTKGKYGMLGA